MSVGAKVVVKRIVGCCGTCDDILSVWRGHCHVARSQVLINGELLAKDLVKRID